MIIRSKVPLRLGLAGGGTDLSPYCDNYGGFVLNATIDMHTYCTIELTDDRKIVFVAADREEFYEMDASDHLLIDGRFDLHKGVYNRVIKQFNQNRAISMRLTTYSDAPAGAGLGTSSALVVAMLKAYEELLHIPLGDYELAKLAFDIERKDIGLSGGKQDQYAATFGGFNFMEFYGDDRVIVNPLRIKNWIVNELESSMILFYSGTSRQSAKIIDEQIRNTVLKKQKSIEAMNELKMDAVKMKEAILMGDIALFAKYLGKSWEAKKRTASVITNKKLDNLYNIAIKAGAYSGKVSGAGGGGFMIFMVNPVRRNNLVKYLQKSDGSVINFHFTKNGAQAWTLDRNKTSLELKSNA